MGDSPELVPTEVATDLESDDMLPVGLPQTASEQVASNGALEEGAAGTNVFDPNARTPFAAVPFAPQLHMYRQNFQQNIMIGESPEQTRSLLGELETEAENRHQRFRQAAEYAHDQRIANVEERANRQHEEIVAQLESEIATQRYQFIEANHHLVSELRQQHQVIAFQTEHFSSVSSQITQLRTTLIEEAEENKTQTLNEVGEWFGREHDQAMQQYRLLARESEEEMRRQNDVLQDELSSAERALKLEQDRNASQDTASQAQFPPAVTPATVPQSAGLNVPTAPQFSSPSVIPLSLRAMFSGFGGAVTTATPAGPQAPTQAPGTPVPPTGLGGGVSGLAAPMGTPASPAATGVDLIAQTQQALLEAAKLLKGDKGGEDDKPKAEGRNALRQGVAGEEIALPEKDRRAACCISIAAAASIRPEGDDPQDGEKDYWEVDFKRGEAIRHHLNYRSTMYKPEMSCPVALEKLKGTAKVIKTLPVAPYTAKESWDWKGGKGGTNDKTPWTGKTVFKIKEQNKKVKFCEKPKVREIPFEGKGYKHSYKVRRYNTCYADAENCPKPDNNDLQVAIRNARELTMLLARHEGGERTDCRLECDEPDSLMCGMCKHVVESSEIACPGIATPLEFLADTGSEEDLISEADRAMYFGEEPIGNATRQVNLITANGNVKGDKSVRIDFPEFGKELEFYVLASTPPVCSVGRRCMEDGYEFHWYPKKPPYFVAPNGQRLRCRMRGMVPVLGGGAMAAPSTNEEASGSLGRPILSEGFQKSAAQ
ncbi:unnamed protein product [Symbiodinium natans]|uniref:Peptidase A2 domain-containing protein n=1 Tax=Symbiodinium natans TaxID=878477 RepID=A0A812QL91_9DINO|nr:unnamed protein product [Symbiodinium natans]